MQTRKQSAVEVLVGTAIGLTLSVVVGQLLIYPAFGVHPSWIANVWMTGCFTVVSIARSYLTRRFFNWLNSR
jgi:hypothetical protein